MPGAYDRGPTQRSATPGPLPLRPQWPHVGSHPMTQTDEAGYAEGPVAALRRIAFLLERSRAETYKVKAFRSAAATVLPLGDAELERRVAEGTLKDLPGIGASTAAVIADAVGGKVPDRLGEAG